MQPRKNDIKIALSKNLPVPSPDTKRAMRAEGVDDIKQASIATQMAARYVEPTPDTWSPDAVVEAGLAVGRLRGAIDASKCAADRLHRARKCPDAFIVRQLSAMENDVEQLGNAAQELANALAALRAAIRG